MYYGLTEQYRNIFFSIRTEYFSNDTVWFITAVLCLFKVLYRFFVKQNVKILFKAMLKLQIYELQ